MTRATNEMEWRRARVFKLPKAIKLACVFKLSETYFLRAFEESTLNAQVLGVAEKAKF